MIYHNDSFRHRGMRRRMLEMLREKGIENEAVLKAMGRVPRHFFIDRGLEEHAYQDKAFPIGAGQTISNPYTVAFQTTLLEIEDGSKVLEIGTGSGYQTCVLLELGAEVYSLERQKELFEIVDRRLLEMGYHPKQLICGDGYVGLPDQAPFDGIIVTAGAPSVPNTLLAQLKVGGRLVIPVGKGEQKMNLFIRQSQKEFKKRELGVFQFVPMLDGCED